MTTIKIIIKKKCLYRLPLLGESSVHEELEMKYKPWSKSTGPKVAIVKNTVHSSESNSSDLTTSDGSMCCNC